MIMYAMHYQKGVTRSSYSEGYAGITCGSQVPPSDVLPLFVLEAGTHGVAQAVYAVLPQPFSGGNHRHTPRLLAYNSLS